jgi:hypothetical protein
MSDFHTEESKMMAHGMKFSEMIESRPQEMSNSNYRTETDVKILEAQYREFI